MLTSILSVLAKELIRHIPERYIVFVEWIDNRKPWFQLHNLLIQGMKLTQTVNLEQRECLKSSISLNIM